MKAITRWIYSGLLTTVSLLLIILFLTHSLPAAGKQNEQNPALPPEERQAEQLRQALQRDSLSEPARRSLQEKLAMAEQMAAEQAAGAQAPRQEKVAPPLPAAALQTQAEPQPELEGIFEGSQGLIKPAMADIRNVWQAERDGILIQVFAGALPDQPEQGLVLIVQIRPDLRRTMEMRQAPGATGALRIIEARQALLLLAAEDGSRLTFDLNTLSFQE